MLRERFGVGKIVGMALVLAEVAVIVGAREDVGHLFAPRYVLGNVLMLFSGLGCGIYAIANKALAQRVGTAAMTKPNDDDGRDRSRARLARPSFNCVRNRRRPRGL